MREVAERVDQDERGLGRDLAQPLAAGGRSDRTQELLAGALDAVDLAGGERPLGLAAGPLDVGREAPEPRPRDPAAEPRGGRLLEPVRLVEDHGVVLGQHAAAGGDVREVERVVDDHEIGGRGPLARMLGETRGDERAAPAGTTVRPDRELRPEGFGRLEAELGTIAGLGGVEPVLHRLPGAGVAAVGEQERLEALQLAAAEVVRPSLEHLHPHVPSDRGCGDRDVLGEQLLLERLGRRRDDDPPPGLECGDQIGEALPDAGARLGDEMLAGLERPFDAGRERGLLAPRLVLGKRMRERPTGAEDVLHRRQATGANGRSHGAGSR